MTSTIGTRKAKDDLFESFASVAAAMASGRRLEIIDVLAQAPRTVVEVEGALDQSVANTSHHLRRLADDGLVSTERRGRHVIYRLASDQMYDLWRALQEATAAHQPDLGHRAEAYTGARDEIPVMDHDTLRRLLDRDEDLVLIDVRPEVEYAAGHIDGAVSVPPQRLDELLPQLPGEGQVVAYCRGRYCAYADQAVRRIRASGRTAYRLADGYREWLSPATH
jgi:DNA-binding transcriptional ArsR family regulator/rhodanese-related sulfurtransferase